MPYYRKLRKTSRKPHEPVFNVMYDLYGFKRHLVGKPGPRGGARSLCGLAASRISRWGVSCLRYAEVSDLNNICPDCRKRVVA